MAKDLILPPPGEQQVPRFAQDDNFVLEQDSTLY
jgi:hypothetical protein